MPNATPPVSPVHISATNVSGGRYVSITAPGFLFSVLDEHPDDKRSAKVVVEEFIADGRAKLRREEERLARIEALLVEAR